MKNSLRLLIPGFFAASMLFALTGAQHFHRIEPPNGEVLEAPESSENPGAREQWEWLQLRDPKTGEIPRGIHRRELAYASTLPVHGDRWAGSGKNENSLLGAHYKWNQRGPNGVGGRTRALAFDLTNPNVMFSGATTGGMWRSTDKGESWRTTSSLSQFPSVTCLAQDPRPGKTNTWYYGTGEFRGPSHRFGGSLYPGDGIYKSVDGGLSWAPLSATVTSTPQTLDQPFDFVNKIVVDPAAHAGLDIVYAACYGSIMRSTDGGTTWKAVLGGLNNPTGYSDVAVTQGGVLYAALGTGGATHGFFRSTDGLTWANISPSDIGDSARGVAIGIAPSDPTIVYFLSETEGRGLPVQGLYGPTEWYSFWRYDYKSGDGSGAGGTWNDRSGTLPQQNTYWTYNSLASYALTVNVIPNNPDGVFLGGSNLYYSPDGYSSPSSWHWLGGYTNEFGQGNDSLPLHPDQHSFAFNPSDPSIIYAGCDGGIMKCTDWSQAEYPNWGRVNNGYVTTQFYSVAIDHATPGSDVIIGGAQDNGTFSSIIDPSSGQLDQILGGDGCMCALADGGKACIASWQNGNVYALFPNNSNGGGWQYAAPDTSENLSNSYLFLAPLALDPSNTEIEYIAAGTQLWRDNNPRRYDASFDPNWRRIADLQGADTITAIGISKNAPASRAYIGTKTGKIFVMDNAGTASETPRAITGENFPTNGFVNCVAVDPANGDNAIAVFSNYNVMSLYSTTNGGTSWEAVGGNLEQNSDGTGDGPSCRWAAYLHRPNGTVIFVGTSAGLYSTTKINGNSTVWELEGATTIGNVIVDMVDVRQSDGFVGVATWGRGLFSATIDTVEFAGIAEATTGEHALLGASYPNPARTQTTIPFTVPQGKAGGQVKLELFDNLGRKRATLADAYYAAGSHTARYDLAANPSGPLPPGTYYYRATIGDAVETRTMVITER